MIFSDTFFPYIVGFLVERHALFLATFKYRYVQVFFWYFIYFSQQFPRPANGFFFEVVAKRPVAEHLEHRMVIGIAPYLFEVVVFARYAQTFLGIYHTCLFRFSIAEEKLFKLVHTRVSEHQGRVVFNNHRSRRNDGMPFALKEF